jgi:hypothetical protein
MNNITSSPSIESIYNGQLYETSLDKPTLTFHAKQKCKQCHGKGYQEYSWPKSYTWTVTCECINRKMTSLKNK